MHLAQAVLVLAFVGVPLVAQSPGTGDTATWSLLRTASTRGGSAPFGAVPPGAVRFDDQGRVYLLDIQAAVVYRFGPDLTPQGSIGRRGRGPGEFVQPTLLGVGAGIVAVFDPGTSRLTVFRNGEREWDLTWPLATRGIPRRLEVVGDDVLMEVEPFPFRAEGSTGAPRTRPEAPRILRVRRDGTTEPLATFAEELSAGPQPASNARRPVIFAPAIHWTAGPGPRLFTSISDRYLVETRDLTSGARRRFASRGSVFAAPTSDEVRNAVREQTLRRFAENRGQPALSGLNEDVVRQSIADMEFAARLPLTAELIHGVGDLLLVQRGIGLVDPHSPPGGEMTLVPVAWDVFQRDGSYAGVVEFPEGFMPVDGFGDRVVGVREGDLGEVVLEVFRIWSS